MRQMFVIEHDPKLRVRSNFIAEQQDISATVSRGSSQFCGQLRKAERAAGRTRLQRPSDLVEFTSQLQADERLMMPGLVGGCRSNSPIPTLMGRDHDAKGAA